MPRKNKSKDEITEEIKRTQKIAHIKKVVKDIFPKLEVETIYDAQTVLNALSGFIKADLEDKTIEIKLGDLDIDLKKEKESKIKKSMVEIIRFMADEPAMDFAEILDRLSKAFYDFGATKFIKGPMSEVSLEDLLAS